MRYLSLGLATCILIFVTSAASSCPFCSAPSLTLTEQFTDADAVVLVKWTEGEPATEEAPGSASYEIVEVTRTKGIRLKKGQELKLPRYRKAKKGETFVLMGTQGRSMDWSSTIPVDNDSYAYMSEAPSPDLPTSKRLEYFVKYLEHPDEMVSMDAYGEFANAPYEDIAAIRDKLPRDKLRKWVANSETPVTRLGLYGLLLGLCGNEDDAALMEKIVVKTSQDYRLGLDGVISGYLLIKGDKGLDVLDKTKLANDKYKDENGEMLEIPFSETYAVVGALRFMWSFGKDRIPKERLRQSMRLLLNRPSMVDLIIPDLARWKDWSISEDLFKMYTKKEYNQRAIKLAIVKFLYHCSKKREKDSEEVPAYAAKAADFLARIKEIDPKTVKDAKRTMIMR